MLNFIILSTRSCCLYHFNVTEPEYKKGGKYLKQRHILKKFFMEAGKEMNKKRKYISILLSYILGGKPKQLRGILVLQLKLQQVVLMIKMKIVVCHILL